MRELRHVTPEDKFGTPVIVLRDNGQVVLTDLLEAGDLHGRPVAWVSGIAGCYDVRRVFVLPLDRERIEHVLSEFDHLVEQAMARHERQGGQTCGTGGEFAGFPKGVLMRLRKWSERFRLALEGKW